MDIKLDQVALFVNEINAKCLGEINLYNRRCHKINLLKENLQYFWIFPKSIKISEEKNIELKIRKLK
jgi:hypothetical protein